MAESKLTDQPVLTTAAAGDYVYVVDVSDTSGGAAGTSKKATITTLMGQAPVVSVNGRTGVVVLSLDDLNDVTATGPTTDDTLVWNGTAWVLSSGLRDIKNVVKYPSGTLTGLQVNATNKIEIDSTNQNVTFTVNGNVVAVIGTTQTSVPGLSVGPTGTTYALPTARGTTTGHVIVYDSSTHTSTWSALTTSQLSGTSDGLTEGTVKLLMTSAERTKLAGITAGAAVASVSGTAPIVSSGGTTPAISITAATPSAAGSMSASDKTKLDGITAGAAVASVTGTAPIVSSGGTSPAISITAATTSAAGSMSAADKTKLDGIQAGAQVNAVTSVNTQTGAVVLTTANITENTNLYYTDARFDTRFGTKSTTNLTEGTNLYFTNARADARTLGANNQTLTGVRTINLNSNILNYVNGGTTIFQVNTTLLSSWVPLSVQSGSATAQSLQLFEGSSGNNYIALKAPDTLTANTTYTFPAADGTSGQVLATNGSGNLLWVTGGGGGGGVTAVTGTAPIVSSGGATPAISITAATTSAAGSMSAADKTKLDGIQSGAEVNVNADWNAVSGDALIMNKPDIPAQYMRSGTVTAGFTLAITDGNKFYICNSASAMTITVPLESSVAFDIDTEIAFMQKGTGAVTIAGASGVSILTSQTAKTAKANAVIAIKKIDTNGWVCVGEREAV